jgi:hypothetical protein
MSGLERIDPRPRGRGRRPNPDAVEGVASAWDAAVGADVARHARPARFAAGALVVHCSSSTWASELSLLERTVLARLRDVLGEASPARLRFQLGEVVDERARGAPPPPLAASPADRRVARETTRCLSDPALRAEVERALLASLARGRADGADGRPC